MNSWKYNGFGYLRRTTRTVHVGDIAIGSEHPSRDDSALEQDNGFLTPLSPGIAPDLAVVVKPARDATLGFDTHEEAFDLRIRRAGNRRLPVTIAHGFPDHHIGPPAAAVLLHQVITGRGNALKRLLLPALKPSGRKRSYRGLSLPAGAGQPKHRQQYHPPGIHDSATCSAARAARRS